ncbi:uncharacterized protein B0H64DRAFT_225586 [Chaetomium fimeti]|uniref:PAS domain-containing protein n=1 Tax=Chaetomium fimeti TaxID=1854472 RepID=A0AAE0HB25_9PEZI|nr:hypothetical protein B0H64DRAFT_225586 [Chaetomium fimeti]
MDPRDQTFMTIHNLTPDANILFASDSILDILGYQPDEVRGKSAFEYFHPEEVPFARSVHSRGVLLDKAAVLHYARIVAKNGQWMSCECCFTVVHNVLVASTSIYFRGERSERRARDAPQIRRIFSSSPRDPRYHMLEHLSPKFKMPPMEREPRAALILNRFTRNLTIMYATDAVAQILGIRSDELLEKPFYECIQPNCLDEAERCLESAKANESIAYLRFWYKDPRIDPNDPLNEEGVDETEDGADDRSSPSASEVDVKDEGLRNGCMDIDDGSNLRTRGGEDGAGNDARGRSHRQSPQTFELEAVVSCTSDGLVVVLRRARPPIPDPQPPVAPAALNFENGLFAAPWGQQPIEPYISPDLLYTFRPPLLPQYMPLRECVKAAGGPPIDQLMRSIRDVAVFAWAVTGINPTLAENYGQGGRPRINSGGQAPVDGLPTWESGSRRSTYPSSEDMSADRNDAPKEPLTTNPAFGRGSGNGLYASEPSSIHGYRTRHASLDENMYDSSNSRQAGWAASPYPYGSGGGGRRSGSGSGSARGYEGAAAGGYHHRRPPLRPAFSYDALQDHARHQQQAYAPASASEAAARRCNFREEIWHAAAAAGEAAAAGRGCIPTAYGGAGGPPSRGVGGSGGGGGGGPAGAGGESSKTAGARARERYFWE